MGSCIETFLVLLSLLLNIKWECYLNKKPSPSTAVSGPVFIFLIGNFHVHMPCSTMIFWEVKLLSWKESRVVPKKETGWYPHGLDGFFEKSAWKGTSNHRQCTVSNITIPLKSVFHLFMAAEELHSDNKLQFSNQRRGGQVIRNKSPWMSWPYPLIQWWVAFLTFSTATDTSIRDEGKTQHYGLLATTNVKVNFRNCFYF